MMFQGVARLAVFMAVVLAAPLEAAEHAKESLEAIKKCVDEKKGVLIDVREKAEWDKGHVEGAVFLPLTELKKGLSDEQFAKRVPKGKILYVHCASGVRSLMAAKYLEKNYRDVRPLKPGYKHLLDAGFKKAKE